jgi:acetylornithine deacetylase/succinyl-diaminopimelate desuccinylase-like protein
VAPAARPRHARARLGPFGADNALVKAAEVVRRIATYEPRADHRPLGELRRRVDLTEAERKALRDPDTVLEACRALPDQGIAKLAHACTRTTFSPNVAHGGVKTNVIPDVVDLDIDIRVMPGETNEDVRAHIDAALGDLSSEVELSIIQAGEYTRSPTDTPLYSALEKVAQRVYPDATLMPVMTVGGTDARFYRNAGSLAYGFGLMSPDVTYQKFRSRFHGNDERVDVESLRLTTDCWLAIVEDVLG